MDIEKDLVNLGTNYLERVLDKTTIKNISNFGSLYKAYLVSDLTKGNDTVYKDELSKRIHLVILLVLDEDLPALYIGEVIAKMAKEKTTLEMMARHKLNDVSLSNCQRNYANNADLNTIIANIDTKYSEIFNLLGKLPPKEICLYQQFNICCYTEEYINKYSIQNKLGYGDLENINDEVAKIYNFVFNPSAPKTASDKLGEYYLRVNDSNPDIFLDPSNELFLISSLMNYSYNEVLLGLFDELSYSPLKEEITDIDSWANLSKKYRLFFRLLRENTLSY